MVLHKTASLALLSALHLISCAGSGEERRRSCDAAVARALDLEPPAAADAAALPAEERAKHRAARAGALGPRLRAHCESRPTAYADCLASAADQAALAACD